VILKTYATTTYAFVAFCLAVWLSAAFLIKPRQPVIKKIEYDYADIVFGLFWTILILMAGTFYIMYKTEIGLMAAESAYLPLRIAGWVLYVRLMLIPGLLLLFIWCSDKSGLMGYFSLGIILLILHGVSDMLLRASRGALLGLFIGLTMLFIVTNRLTTRRAQLGIFIFILTVLAWPFISSYRLIRSGGYTVPLPDFFNDIIAFINTSSSFGEMLRAGIYSIFFRGGMISLFPIVGKGLEPLGTQVFKTSVSRFFTVQVLGYSPELIQGSAPSLVGWFYLVGQNPFVIIGILIFVSSSYLYWQVLSRSRLRCLPVAQALSLYVLFNLSLEGTLEGLYLRLLVLTGTISACEWFMRIFGKRRYVVMLQET